MRRYTERDSGGSDGLLVKFQQRYRMSYRSFRNLLCSKNVGRFCGSPKSALVFDPDCWLFLNIKHLRGLIVPRELLYLDASWTLFCWPSLSLGM
jgi:hypothetical protein